MKPRILVFACVAASSPLLTQQPQTRELAYDVSVDVAVRPPALFTGDDGKPYLGYYAVITNFGRQEVVFSRIDVLDAATGAVIAALDTSRLRRGFTLQVSVPDRQRPETMRHLPPGRVAVFRALFPLDSGRAAPRRLVHRITFEPIAGLRIARTQTDTDAAPVVTTPAVAVQPPPMVIGPPLRGGPWRAGGAAGLNNQHLSLTTIDGRARMPERFAVDFQLVDSAINVLPNPFAARLTNSWFYAYRAEVLAVADGRVAFVRDGIPENTPTPSGDENMPVPLTRESVAGNQISIEIAPGVFAMYAHLVPGHLRVHVGDRVRKGQVIGYVGNAGNAKNPHLHFELIDGPEINAADGVPWEIDSFDLWGHLGGDNMPDMQRPPVRHTRQMLLQDAIVRFAPAPRAAVAVAILPDEADPALAWIEAKRDGREPSESEMRRLLRSEGYGALKTRAQTEGRPLSDSAFQGFLLSDALAPQAAALSIAIQSYRAVEPPDLAANALKYLPAGATIRAHILPVIKPVRGDFTVIRDGVYQVVVDVTPGESPASVERSLVSALYRIGRSSVCRRPASSQSLADLLDFSDGIALHAAAGSGDLADVAPSMREVERLIQNVLDRRITSPDSASARARRTIGWLMASTVEHTSGRDQVVATACDPVALMRRYNQAASRSGRGAGVPLWSEAVLHRLEALRGSP
jgi:murein DD-endopeptidase MepM/ murein hydrolase activator NlpD